MGPDLFESYQTSFPSSAHWPRSHSRWMSYGLPNEALSGCRWTKSSTLMNFHYETHLNLQSNSNMYMWNLVNYNQSHYANIGTSAPYNHCSYPKVPCPHHTSRWMWCFSSGLHSLSTKESKWLHFLGRKSFSSSQEHHALFEQPTSLINLVGWCHDRSKTIGNCLDGMLSGRRLQKLKPHWSKEGHRRVAS
jgi:hypothetical protein